MTLRTGAPVRTGLVAAALMIAAAGCGGGSGTKAGAGGPSPAGGSTQSSTAGAPSASAGVTSLGPESGPGRLAAARALPGPAPVSVALTSDGKADLAKWPDACSLLTTAQIRAIVPGHYAIVPTGSTNTIPPINGVGQTARPDECEWQLGGGSFGTRFTVLLTDQEPVGVNQPAGTGPVVDEGNGITCQTGQGSVDCARGTWGWQVLGSLVGTNGEGVTDSPDLVSKLLTPVAVLVGSVLQGS